MKHRKARASGKLASSSEIPISVGGAACTGDGTVTIVCASYPGRSAGFRASGRPENERTKVRWASRSQSAEYDHKPGESRVQPGESSTPGEGRRRRSTNRRGSLAYVLGQQKTRWVRPSGSSAGWRLTDQLLLRARRRSQSVRRRQPRRRRWNTRRPGAARARTGIEEVANRPAAGVTTRGAEEPDVNSTRPVL